MDRPVDNTQEREADDALLRLRRSLGPNYEVGRPVTISTQEWSICLATELSTGRRVAVKAVEYANPVDARRFEIEVGSVVRPPGWLGQPDFGHPGLVPVLHIGYDDRMLYYLTPWLAEGSLQARLRREQRLSPVAACRLLDDVAETLSFLHQRHFLHRRLKPENILFDTGRPVLSDGFSRLLFLTSLPSPWDAPEHSAAARPGPCIDVYSLGAVVYCMLTGQQPPSATDRVIRNASLVGLNQLHTPVSTALQALLRRMLALRTQDRPASMEAVRQELRAVPEWSEDA